MAASSSPSKEKFLIVDVAASGTNALFLYFDERRELIFKKAADNVDLKEFLAAQAGSIFQKSWEGNYFFNSRRRLMVLADASRATTIPVPLDFKRDAAAAKEPLALGEMEELFSRAMAKIFIKCRTEAARRLRTSDVDTVLVNQRVDRVAIDGRPVPGPVGRSGKKISFVVELTFANRELAETLAPFFNAPGEFFFAQAPQARAAALARVKSLPLNIIEAGDSGTSSLIVFQETEHGCPVAYHEPFAWDGTAGIRSIAKDLGVTAALAEEIYGQYVRGEVSDAAKKHFDALTASWTAGLFQAMDKANISGPVYFDMPRGLPFKIPHRRRRAMIEDVPVAALLKKFGFSMDDPAAAGRAAFRYLVPFFELYFDNNQSELNELLRRKLHWLS